MLLIKFYIITILCLVTFQVGASSLMGTEMEDFSDKSVDGKRTRNPDIDPVKNEALLKKQKPLTKREKARQMYALDLGGPCSDYNFSKMSPQLLEELF